MKLSQLLTAPNQLTLLRMMFVPFIVINLVAGHPRWALVLFVLAGFSDGLDGLLARTLKQQTVLGQYLDPIADKLLLSTMFMVLAILHKIAWKYTVLVFSRDISILCASAVLYAIAGLRDFRPSIFGKANTFAQVAAIFFVMLFQIKHAPGRTAGEATRAVGSAIKTKSPSAEADGELRFRTEALFTYAAFSLACATRNIVLSSKCRAKICNPMGNFSLVCPQGTEIPGIPARSAVTV